MCLAVPGKVVSISGDTPMDRRGKVDFGGILKEIHFAYVPEVKINDYVIVHVGFALNILDEEEALATLKTFEELDEALKAEEV